MDMDGDDFVFYGTPIEREEELTSRKKKAVADASGSLRSLPAWKQEVRDEEGRRRFHGAFTGGFSAGYFNTVGSKEGWTPQSFTSSRKKRADVKQQSIFNFLDEDERAELEDHSLGASSQFDTFGFTASEYAREHAEKEHKKRPSAIPGPVPEEIILPATESIGVKLLLKMGWRRGRSIKDSCPSSLYDARREARKALLAFSFGDNRANNANTTNKENDAQGISEDLTTEDTYTSTSTPIYVLNPKSDLHGLGFDPYKNAPEFREKKRSDHKQYDNKKSNVLKDCLFGSKSGKVAPGFGIGALEEYDIEDEDVYSAYDMGDGVEEETEEPSKPRNDHEENRLYKEHGVLPGFKIASNSTWHIERYDPPDIPKEFVPYHKFDGPLESEFRSARPDPPEAPPPEDNNLRRLIDGVAALVHRCGKVFEDLSREKNKTNPMFAFLDAGPGHDYYERRLWEEQQKGGRGNKPAPNKTSGRGEVMTAEIRGKLLGERPLERGPEQSGPSVTDPADVSFKSNLLDTFTQPGSQMALPETQAFRFDAAKQERFEQFLKEKYQGGLRATDSNASNRMSETDRARERLDFEVAAEAIEKQKSGLGLSVGQSTAFTPGNGPGSRSDSLEVEENVKNNYPVRREFPWRPLPILCKRFDLTDPYMGKLAPPLRTKTRTESRYPVSDEIKKLEAVFATKEKASLDANGGVEDGVEVQDPERPVDLYKAIFSDDSGDDAETPVVKVGDDEKKGAVEATLNRLIADDFLDSVGKELGLEMPSDAMNASSGRRRGASQNADLVSSRSPDFPAKNMCAAEEPNSRGESRGRRETGVEKNTKRGSSHRERHSSSDSEEGRWNARERHGEDSVSRDRRDEGKGRYTRDKRNGERHSKHHRRRSRDSYSRERYSHDRDRSRRRR